MNEMEKLLAEIALQLKRIANAKDKAAETQTRPVSALERVVYVLNKGRLT